MELFFWVRFCLFLNVVVIGGFCVFCRCFCWGFVYFDVLFLVELLCSVFCFCFACVSFLLLDSVGKEEGADVCGHGFNAGQRWSSPS